MVAFIIILDVEVSFVRIIIVFADILAPAFAVLQLLHRKQLFFLCLEQAQIDLLLLSWSGIVWYLFFFFIDLYGFRLTFVLFLAALIFFLVVDVWLLFGFGQIDVLIHCAVIVFSDINILFQMIERRHLRILSQYQYMPVSPGHTLPLLRFDLTPDHRQFGRRLDRQDLLLPFGFVVFLLLGQMHERPVGSIPLMFLVTLKYRVHPWWAFPSRFLFSVLTLQHFRPSLVDFLIKIFHFLRSWILQISIILAPFRRTRYPRWTQRNRILV